MYTINEKVRYSEVDEKRQLTLTGIVNYFQDCSTFQSEDIGHGIAFLEAHKRVWVLSSWQIVVERYPTFGEEIKVSTWPTSFQGLYGTRNFLMEDADGNTLAYANSIWVFMDAGKARPAKPAPDEISAYKVEPMLPMEYAPRKLTLPDTWDELEAFPVRKCQIDTNHHVNNGKYVEMALEYIPKEKKIKEMRVEYKKSARYGDVIFPKIHREEEKIVVLFCDQNGKEYAAIELIGE